MNVNFLLLSQFYLIFIHVYNMLGSNFPYPLFPPSNPFLFLLYVNFHSVIFVCVFSTSKLCPNFQVKFPSFSCEFPFPSPVTWATCTAEKECHQRQQLSASQSHVGACQVVRHAQPCLMPLGGKERSVPLVPTPCFPRENESQMA